MRRYRVVTSSNSGPVIKGLHVTVRVVSIEHNDSKLSASTDFARALVHA